MATAKSVQIFSGFLISTRFQLYVHYINISCLKVCTYVHTTYLRVVCMNHMKLISPVVTYQNFSFKKTIFVPGIPHKLLMQTLNRELLLLIWNMVQHNEVLVSFVLQIFSLLLCNIQVLFFVIGFSKFGIRDIFSRYEKAYHSDRFLVPYGYV